LATIKGILFFKLNLEEYPKISGKATLYKFRMKGNNEKF